MRNAKLKRGTRGRCQKRGIFSLEKVSLSKNQVFPSTNKVFAASKKVFLPCGKVLARTTEKTVCPPTSVTRNNARKLGENDVIAETIGPAPPMGPRWDTPDHRTRRSPPTKPATWPYLGRIRLFLLRVSIFSAFRAFLRSRERAGPNGQRKRRAQSAPPDSGDRIPLRPLQRRRYSSLGRIVSKIERRGHRAGPLL